MMNKLTGYRSEQQPGEPAQTPGADNKQVSVLCRPKEDCGRGALVNLAADGDPFAFHTLQCFVLEPAGSLGKDVRVMDQAFHSYRHGRERPRGYGVNFAAAQPGLFHCPLQRPA